MVLHAMFLHRSVCGFSCSIFNVVTSSSYGIVQAIVLHARLNRRIGTDGERGRPVDGQLACLWDCRRRLTAGATDDLLEQQRKLL